MPKIPGKMTTQNSTAQGIGMDYMAQKKTLNTNRTGIPGWYFLLQGVQFFQVSLLQNPKI